MANNSNMNKINNLNQKISKQIYGDSDDSEKFSRQLNDIETSFNKINHSFQKNITGDNLIEFLTKMQFNDRNKINMHQFNNLKNSKATVKKNVEEALTTANVQSLVGFERERIERYDDYRTIYSYIPQLSACIEVYVNSIMSPDDFTKSSLNFIYKDNTSKSSDNKLVFENFKYLKNKYHLEERVKEIIRETLILGDNFVAILNYNDEFNKYSLNESVNNNKYILNESEIPIDDDFKKFAHYIYKEDNNKESNNKNKNKLNENKKDNFTGDIYDKIKKDFTNVINKNVNYNDSSSNKLVGFDPDDFQKLFNKRKNNRSYIDDSPDKSKEENFGFTGSIIRILKPENTIKLEINDVCFGYIYIEKDDESPLMYDEKNDINGFNNKDVFNSRYDLDIGENYKNKTEAIVNMFLNGISKKIDNEFIKKNKDFKKYLYTLLKEKYIIEKKINITYLTPDEVVHFLVDKNKTYGQSRLSKSLFFAKLYLSTLITELMQKISRGRDKRITYVETGLDDNIEDVVQGVVRDIKSKEIQSDILKSVTTILNTIGIFDDYYIPLIDGKVFCCL